MSQIAVLPPHLSNLIAAGEVVERPASVVKELLENAVDAGASAVTVEIKRGGVSFIRVTDNGGGMDSEDAARAFLRHATSKLHSEDDLRSIRTLGFRGEALAAIASVCRIDLLTRRPGDELGISLTLEAGKVTSGEPSGCPEGTTIVARELFFNTPARQKFLKKDMTEASHVQETVLRAALGHPEISFRLIKDGTQALHTPGDAILESTLYALFGREFRLGLLPAERQSGDMRAEGFIGKPEMARAGRGQQYFLVLGRPVRSRTLTAALEEAYQGALPSGRSPVCVLHLTLPPEAFDINVHPAKSEIKFGDERALFDMVYHTVKTALEKASPGKPITLNPALTFACQPPEKQTHVQSEMTAVFAAPALCQGQYTETIVYTPLKREPAAALAETIAPPPIRQTPPNPPEPLQNPPETPVIPSYRYIGEALGGYLLAEGVECLWIIDKHAAHERIIYNRLRAQTGGILSQQLMMPKIVTLSNPQCDILLNAGEFLRETGFELDSMGAGTLAVRAAPGDIDVEDIPALLSELSDLLSSGRRPDLRERALQIIACKAAIKLGSSSAPEDMRSLCRQVMEQNDLRHCPHGRPIAVRVTRSELGRQFLR